MKSLVLGFAAGFLLAATCNADEVVEIQIIPQSSSANGSLLLEPHLPGSLIGDYDATSNPDGTLTRPGLFGGSGNQSVALEMTGNLDGDIDSQPLGSYQLGLDIEALSATISNFELDVLGGKPGTLALSLDLEFETFRTFQPDSLFLGVPLNLPVGDGTITVMSIQQENPAVVAQLMSQGPDQYSFSVLVPVTIAIESEILKQPLNLPPAALVIQLDGNIQVNGDQVIVTQSFTQMLGDEITDIPGGEYSDIPFPVPTVLPPGGTANLLLSGTVESISYELELTTTLTGEGEMSAFVLGDLNGDGVVNLLDVSPFVDAIVAGEFVPVADINCDGEVNLLDVAAFIDLLIG